MRQHKGPCADREQKPVLEKKYNYDQIINLIHGFSNCGLQSSQE
jgi:hypothetical protein